MVGTHGDSRFSRNTSNNFSNELQHIPECGLVNHDSLMFWLTNTVELTIEATRTVLRGKSHVFNLTSLKCPGEYNFVTAEIILCSIVKSCVWTASNALLTSIPRSLSVRNTWERQPKEGTECYSLVCFNSFCCWNLSRFCSFPRSSSRYLSLTRFAVAFIPLCHHSYSCGLPLP